MTHLATWADPVVRWDSKLYSWDGEPILSEDTADTLRQRSVFARVVTPRPFACVEQQRLHARVTDGH